MTLAGLAFYLLSGMAVLSALMVVSLRNPVHSVLFLILTFFSAAGLFVLLGAEFLAMLLVVVYVGAVAVLFLFVVMMLDVDFVELKQGFTRYLPLGLLVALALLAQLVVVSLAWLERAGPDRAPLASVPGLTNTETLGRVLYTDHVLLFQLAGMVLLVAMIGAVVLTLRHRPGVRRQDVSAQVGRSRAKAVKLHDIRPGQGLN